MRELPPGATVSAGDGQVMKDADPPFSVIASRFGVDCVNVHADELDQIERKGLQNGVVRVCPGRARDLMPDCGTDGTSPARPVPAGGSLDSTAAGLLYGRIAAIRRP
jgi:hypothetical protein